MKVQVIPENANDPIAIATIRDGGRDNLFDLQHIVGGYVEQIQTNTLEFKRNVMLVDENGKWKEKKANYRAMSMTGYAGMVVGTAIICGLKPGSEPGTTQWGDFNE